MNIFVPVLYVHDRIKIQVFRRGCLRRSVVCPVEDRRTVQHDCVWMDFHGVGSQSVIVETASVCQAPWKIFGTIILRQQM